MGQIIVIVGSQDSKWNDTGAVKAINAIHSILDRYKLGNVAIASGECPFGGIDKWVQREATWKGFMFMGYPPESKSWGDKWIPYEEFLKNNPFKVTPLRHWKCPICQEKAYLNTTNNKAVKCPKCGMDMYIRARGYKYRNMEMVIHGDEFFSIDPKGVWSGGRWTIKEAKKLGKIVHQIEIEQ